MSSVMASKVSDFAARPLIKQCLAKPKEMHSVLSFFFGVDTKGPGIPAMQKGEPLKDMMQLWFGGGEEYDKLCQPFAETVRAAGSNNWPGNEDDKSVDATMARLICCDQLARNIFRGNSEAFKYGEPALQAARSLSDSVLGSETCSNGELYPPYLNFVVVAFMHSESRDDHETAMQLIKYAKENMTTLSDSWDNLEKFELDHKKVVDKFGRYPHRNRLHDRENTPEEEEWLNDTENMPAWAKSQG